MKRFLFGSLGCTLAWLAAAHAQSPGTPAGRPAAGISLGRPQALSDAPARSEAPARLSPLITGGAIQLAGFRAPAETVVTMPAASAPSPMPMPALEMDLATPLAPRGSLFAAGDVLLPASTDGGFAQDATPVQAPPAVPVAPAPVSSVPPATVAPMPAGGLVPRLTDWCCSPSAGPAPGGCCDGGGVCGDSCCGDGYGMDGNKCYVRAEYLLWALKGVNLPVLVTTSPAASQGILGQPGTVVLYGGNTEQFDPFHGGRFTLGWWCDPCHRWAIETTGFFLGQNKLKFDADSSQYPLLGRPFFNINEGREDAQLTAAPGIATGQVTIRHPTSLWGIETNVRCAPKCDSWFPNCQWFAGVRYVDLGEGLHITEDVTVVGNINPPAQLGDRAIVGDIFMTRNQFVGGQIGFESEWRWGKWLLNVKPKVALGVNHQTITIDGFQSVQRGGQTLPFVGGLLALPSNIGRFERNRFSVVPEIGVNIGYQFTESLTAYVGYTFMYWSNVVRPADQIDRVLDINQIPNFRPPAPAAPQRRPLVPFKESSFWAQGLNVGLEYKY